MKKYPARVAAAAGVLTAVAAAIVSILGAVDSTAKAIVVGVALICATALVAVWLIGQQKHEDRTAVGGRRR